MARQFFRLIIFTVLTAGTAALAQDPAKPAPKPGESPAAPAFEKKGGNKMERQFSKPGEQGEFVKKFFERMTPEERERFRENFERWKAMPMEERQALLMHEKMRREKMSQEIDDALKKTGLQLDKDRQEVFALRYSQERRKIEEQLRKEIEEKRRPLMNEMLERLRAEFNSQAASSPLPSASPAPAKP